MKFKSIVILLVILLLATTAVCAEEYRAEVNEEGTIIYGSDLAPDSPALIVITKSTDALAVPSPATIKRVMQVMSDDEGNFATPLFQLGESGVEYTAVIKVSGAASSVKHPFYIMSEGEIPGIFDAFIAADTYQKMELFLGSYADELNIDMSVMGDYAHPERIYQTLSEERTTATDVYGINNLFMDTLADAAAIEELNASSFSDFVTILNENNDRFNLPLTEKWGFAALLGSNASARLEAVYNSVHNAEYMKTLREEFPKAVALEAYNAVKWQDMLTVINQNSSAFVALDGGRFDNLRDDYKHNIHEDIRSEGITFTSIESMVTYLNEAAQNEGSDDNGGSYKPSAGTPSIPAGGTVAEIPSTTVDTSVLPFSDLDSVEWAKESIAVLYRKGVINGVSDTTFVPNDLVKREEFTKMLIAAFDEQIYGAVTNFQDVDRNSWCYPYIASGQTLGIVTGQSQTQFGVGKPITRQDVVTLLYRMLQNKKCLLPANAPSIQFADSDQFAEYAVPAIQAMQQAGIVNGKSNGVFAPNDYTTRAEAAKMICGALAAFEGR